MQRMCGLPASAMVFINRRACYQEFIETVGANHLHHVTWYACSGGQVIVVGLSVCMPVDQEKSVSQEPRSTPLF